MFDSSQDGVGDDKDSSGDRSGDEGLPPSIARAWRTFDVAKQIEYETREHQKAEKAKLQKMMQVFYVSLYCTIFLFCEQQGG